jgi:plasmid maintenance system antidote protein VapI
MRTDEYLNEVKSKLNARSFNEVANALHVSKQAISKIRKGGAVSEHTAILIGKTIGKNPGRVFAEIQADRAQDSETRKFWQGIAKALPYSILAVVYILCKKPAGLKIGSEQPI